jgi:hypothetical protein
MIDKDHNMIKDSTVEGYIMMGEYCNMMDEYYNKMGKFDNMKDDYYNTRDWSFNCNEEAPYTHWTRTTNMMNYWKEKAGETAAM